MNLNDVQKAQVAKWIDDGAKLSEIQTWLASELGLTLTYMEVRFLVDDLKLVPKDPVPTKPIETPPVNQNLTAKPVPEEEVAVPSPTPPTGVGNISVSVDHIARPGALVSGKVTFSDGQKAAWTLDQTGRLGLAADQKGYRPTPGDVEQFQIALQKELAKIGF